MKFLSCCMIDLPASNFYGLKWLLIPYFSQQKKVAKTDITSISISFWKLCEKKSSLETHTGLITPQTLLYCWATVGKEKEKDLSHYSVSFYPGALSVTRPLPRKGENIAALILAHLRRSILFTKGGLIIISICCLNPRTTINDDYRCAWVILTPWLPGMAGCMFSLHSNKISTSTYQGKYYILFSIQNFLFLS